MMLKITFLFFTFLPLCLIGQNNQNTVDFFRSSHHELLLLGDSINSDEPDIAPFRYAAKLYYSTLVHQPGLQKKVGRVYTVTENGNPILFENSPTDQNVHMAFTALTKTGNRIYYTLYSLDEAGKINKSEICFRDRDYHGKWGPIESLPYSLGLKRNLASQPAIGISRDSRSDLLFFVSDMPGGKGKMDIWMCHVERDGSFSAPFNLPFNSPQDDTAPYFEAGSQTLYFSSKGHNSLGGFDVFRTQLITDLEWTNPENLGRPINSYYDDLFFTFNDNGRVSYLSSDRPNITCPNKQPSCRDFDIYEVGLKATVQVFLFDEYDKSQLVGCNLELKEVASGKIINTYLQLENNFASVGLEPAKEYQLIASKPGYYPVFENIRADGKDFFKASYLQLHLVNMYKNGIVKAKNVHQAQDLLTPTTLTASAIDVVAYVEKNEEMFGYPSNDLQKDNISATSVESVPIVDEIPINDEVMRPEKKSYDNGTTLSEKMPISDLPTVVSEELVKENKLVDKTTTTPKDEAAPLHHLAMDSKKLEGENKPIKTVTSFPIDKAVPERFPAKDSKKREGENDPIDAVTSLPIDKVLPERSPPKDSKKLEGENKPNDAVTSLPIDKVLPERSPATASERIERENKFISDVRDLFYFLSNNELMQITNRPQITASILGDPVDHLFYHKSFKCLIAFDLKNNDLDQSGLETMNKYLSSVDGLLKKDQQPSIGITFFNGDNSKTVVYTFRDGNANLASNSFITTFQLPSHYIGILPDPESLKKLLD